MSFVSVCAFFLIPHISWLNSGIRFLKNGFGEIIFGKNSASMRAYKRFYLPYKDAYFPKIVFVFRICIYSYMKIWIVEAIPTAYCIWERCRKLNNSLISFLINAKRVKYTDWYV